MTVSPLQRHTAPQMGRQAKYKHQVASLRKNSCERLTVSLEEYNGTDLLNLSVKRDSTAKHRVGRMKQTARFVSIQIHQLPALIEALKEAEQKAIEIGVLQKENN